MSRTHKELSERVNSYLKERQLSPKGCWQIKAKTLLIILAWALSYWYLFHATSQLGLFCAYLSLIIWTFTFMTASMHDASHQALFKTPRYNYLIAGIYAVIGGSPLIWYHQHVVHHHSFTNVHGEDPDIEGMPLFRFCQNDPWKKHHRWQHIYAIPLYGMLLLYDVWYRDIVAIYQNKYNIRERYSPLFVWSIVIGSHLFHSLLFIIIPYLYFQSILFVAIGYFLFMMTIGLFLAITFQLAHVTGDQVFPISYSRKDDWALLQLSTTSNFANHNSLLTWFLGGLNFQIEHHLFPSISHSHYPAIQNIVESYCKEKGFPYHKQESFSCAIRAHFRHLKEMGENQKQHKIFS